MLLFVIVFNLLLVLLNLYTAWYFWQLRRQMIHLSRQLERLERRSRRLLPLTTTQIRQGQQGTKYLNQQSEKLHQLQLQLSQILLLLNLALRLWQRPPKRSPLGVISFSKK
jgi:hypothetical protein